MGNESSSDKKAIRIHNSYYGDNGKFGEMSKQQIYEEIDKIQGYAPNQQAQPQPQRSAKLKSLVSILQPDPYIKSVNGNCFVCFGIKCDARCFIEIVARGLKNSFYTDACDRTEFSIPIPVYGNFSINIIPDIHNATTNAKAGFVYVTEHVLKFTINESDDGVYHKYVSQSLSTDENTYEIPVNKICNMVSSNETGKCCICNVNDATCSVSRCGHKVVCDNCIEIRRAKFAQCPVCSSSN